MQLHHISLLRASHGRHCIFISEVYNPFHMTCEIGCWARMSEGRRCFVQRSGKNGSREYSACSHPNSTAEACPVMTDRERGYRALELALGNRGYEISSVRSEVIWVS